MGSFHEGNWEMITYLRVKYCDGLEWENEKNRTDPLSASVRFWILVLTNISFGQVR